jgi:hypothetical protein
LEAELQVVKQLTFIGGLKLFCCAVGWNSLVLMEGLATTIFLSVMGWESNPGQLLGTFAETDSLSFHVGTDSNIFKQLTWVILAHGLSASCDINEK